VNGKKTKQVLAAILAASALGFALPGSAYAQTGTQTQTPAYQSSIKVPDQDDDEQAEAAKLASLAKIDGNQAAAAALAKVPGTVLKTELDNENGNLVYSVEIKLANNEARDVKVDAGNGAVLHVEPETEDEEHSDAGDQTNAITKNPFK
jgi:uncharacterized membrane protein YkoI